MYEQYKLIPVHDWIKNDKPYQMNLEYVVDVIEQNMMKTDD